MAKWLKKLAWASGATLLAVLVVIFFALLWYRSASQPQIDGQIKLGRAPATSAAMSPLAPVDIVRDAEGIPHIYAQSAADAYFALGVVHAQDRLWQMEMNRRIAAGRMAEILGPNALPTDRFLRTLGIRKNAEAIFTNLAPESQAALQAYAKGVNSYLANRSGPLPPEFLITGAPQPAPWEPADSIAWQTMMAWDLGANWTQELLRMRLSRRLSLMQINEFLPPYPGDAVLPTRDYTALYRELAGTTQQLTAVSKIAPPSLVEGMGSNSWALAGALTQSGKPLLANDPHLGLSAPSLWYFAHMSAPGLNVIGATLPGMPVVVLGRNDRIAWSFTNTAPDVQDLYLERINPDKPSQYQTPDGWADFKLRREIIKVKGAADVVLEVRETRHGPVISGALPIMEKAPLDAAQYAIAFAWTALRPDDLTLQAGLKFNRAGNWQEFLEGAKDFGAPQQNIVYADVDGNIGFIAPARVPIRKPGNDLKGLAPAPGWDARYDWDGFIPFAALPRQFNPPSQRLVTANQKIVDANYPYFLTSEWALPYRADRIGDLLDAAPRHDIDSFARIQADHVSLAARELLSLLRQSVPQAGRAGTGPAASALKLLASWDGTMAADRPEPLIFTAWMREASRRIFADELGDALMQDYWEQRNVHQSMLQVLNGANGEGAWCANQRLADEARPAAANDKDDVTDVNHAAVASGLAPECAALLAAALDAALDDLVQRYGSDMNRWRWGQAHAAHFTHRPLGQVPLLSRLFNLQVPMPGDTYTINVGRHNLKDEAEPFATRHAAGMRALYDLSDLENSRFIHATGQSGNLLSPLYRNYLERWARVEYVPMQTSRKSVEKNRMGSLRLEP